MTDFSDLRSSIAGVVLLQTDDGFADAVLSWNRRFTHTPDVAVVVATAGDVVEAVRFARAHGISVRVQGTGHGADEPVVGGMLILTRRLNAVTIDPETRIATIGAGSSWAPVIAAAAPHGLLPIAGASGTVGVVGLILGGGLGPLARSHGFASDWVRGFTVVTGAGELVEAAADENADLFWALRGGKVGLGVVTEVRIALAPLADLYGGSLTFDTPDIEAAARAWVEYCASAPDDVTTSIAILHLPDVEQLPPPLRGRTVLTLRFAYPGDTATGERLAAPLRAAAPVYLDALQQLPAADIASIHNDPPDPSASFTAARLLRGVDQEAIGILLDRVGAGTNPPFVGVELRQLGGAIARDVVEGSATGGRGAGFTLTIIGAPNPALFDSVIPAAAAELFDRLGPWLSTETNINFAGRIESAEQFASAWPAAARARLAGVRARVDPDRVLAYRSA